MPKRSLSATAYRFGFNGQEKDNEISGSDGTHYTAMFWEYDARICKRWNIDPKIKVWESPYACFNDNPISIIDENGDDGITSVDKECKEISVEQTIYYWKNGDASQYTNDDKMVNAIQNDKSGIGWNQETVNISDDPNQEDNWTINYTTKFVGISADNFEGYERAAKNKINKNPTANYLINANTGGGQYDDASNAIYVNGSQNLGGALKAFYHEKGESMGMKDEGKNPYSPIYGLYDNGGYFSDKGMNLGIMSWGGGPKSVKPYEYKLHIQSIVNLANTMEGNNLRIHLQGTIKNSTQIK